MIQLPLRCQHDTEEMVDIGRMERRRVDALRAVEGFTCQHGAWNPVFYLTRSLEEAMERLDQIPVTHRNFRYYFAKTLRKAEGIQERSVKHGTV